MASITEIKRVKLSDIRPYERNAKIHGPEQIEKLKKSITEFGNERIKNSSRYRVTMTYSNGFSRIGYLIRIRCKVFLSRVSTAETL